MHPSRARNLGRMDRLDVVIWLLGGRRSLECYQTGECEPRFLFHFLNVGRDLGKMALISSPNRNGNGIRARITGVATTDERKLVGVRDSCPLLDCVQDLLLLRGPHAFGSTK